MTLPKTMTAITIAAPGGPDVMAPAEVQVPDAGPDQVLIRVAAAGVNGPDLAQRRGHYDPPPDASKLLGLEVSGEIVVGAGPWKTGDRVVALTNGGGYAEYVAVSQGQLLPLPRGWSLTEGAALPETFFTIMQTLVLRAGLDGGMSVLVHGAAGGIGGAAILISVALGARPIAIVSSPEKAAYARSLGAVATIDRTHEDFVARTLELTGGLGADRIVDVAGGETAAHNIDAAARYGHIVQIATLGGGKTELQLGKLMMKQLTLSGSTLRPQPPATKAAIAAALRDRIWPKLESGEIPKPRIETYPLAEAAAAHRAMEEKIHFGKIVLRTAFGAAAR